MYLNTTVVFSLCSFFCTVNGGDRGYTSLFILALILADINKARPVGRALRCAGLLSFVTLSVTLSVILSVEEIILDRRVFALHRERDGETS